MDRQLRQGSLFSATSTTFKKNLLDQYLNLSLVSQFGKEIGLDYLRAMGGHQFGKVVGVDQVYGRYELGSSM